MTEQEFDLREDIARGITILLYDFDRDEEVRYWVYREVLQFLHAFHLVSYREIARLASIVESKYFKGFSCREELYYDALFSLGPFTRNTGKWHSSLGTMGRCISQWVINTLVNGIRLGGKNRSWHNSLALETCYFFQCAKWINEEMLDHYRDEVAMSYLTGDLKDETSVIEAVTAVFGNNGDKIDEWIKSVRLPEKAAFLASIKE